MWKSSFQLPVVARTYEPSSPNELAGHILRLLYEGDVSRDIILARKMLE